MVQSLEQFTKPLTGVANRWLKSTITRTKGTFEDLPTFLPRTRSTSQGRIGLWPILRIAVNTC